MGVINRTARGLLSLLDSQTQGVVPGSLGEVIAPVMSMEPFIYGARGMEVLENAATVTVVGFTAGITVPAGETWHVWGIVSQAITLDALTTACRVSPAWRQSAAQSYFNLQESGAAQALVAGVGVVVSHAWFGKWMPLILNQGASITSNVQNLATGGIGVSVQTQVAFFRLQV